MQQGYPEDDRIRACLIQRTFIGNMGIWFPRTFSYACCWFLGLYWISIFFLKEYCNRFHRKKLSDSNLNPVFFFWCNHKLWCQFNPWLRPSCSCVFALKDLLVVFRQDWHGGRGFSRGLQSCSRCPLGSAPSVQCKLLKSSGHHTAST
jgi:hypothetical protein